MPCFCTWKNFFKIGFFDENFFLYLEEIDLCKRVKNKNGKIYIAPAIKIFHMGARSVDKIFSKQVELTRNWHWMWSLFYYNKKHSNFGLGAETFKTKLSIVESSSPCL